MSSLVVAPEPLLSCLDVGDLCCMACVNSLWRKAAGKELQLRVEDISQGSEPCPIPVRNSKRFFQLLPLDFHYHAQLEAEHLPILADAGCTCRTCFQPSTSSDACCPACSCARFDLSYNRPQRTGSAAALGTSKSGAEVAGHTVCTEAKPTTLTAIPVTCAAATGAPPPATAGALMPVGIPAQNVGREPASADPELSLGERPTHASSCPQTNTDSPHSTSTSQTGSSCEDGTGVPLSVSEGSYTECGPACACTPAHCLNRITQQGVVWQLQLVMGAKGWSVLAAEMIPAGAFVCEYVGERLSTVEARARLDIYDGLRIEPSTLFSDGSNDACLRQIGSGNAQPICCRNDVDDGDGGDANAGSGRSGQSKRSSPTARHRSVAADEVDRCNSAPNTPLSKQADPLQAESAGTGRSSPTRAPGGHALLAVREVLPSGLCIRTSIDATRHGNIARFINHACSHASLDPVVVRRSGALLPAVALFAARDIKSGEELTFSYGPPSSGNNSSLAQRCFCGTPACLGFLPDCRD